MDASHFLAALIAGTFLLALSFALRWLTRRISSLLTTLFDDWF